MELYDLFDDVLADLEPMADQVPDVLRIGRRRRAIRRAGLGAAGAAFVIGAGTLMVAAPWTANTRLDPTGRSVSLADYGRLADSTVRRLWPEGLGFGPPSSLGLHFGAGPTPVPLWPAGPPTESLANLPPAELDLARLDPALVDQARTCPRIPAAESPEHFCSVTTLPDGTVVQVGNNVPVFTAPGGERATQLFGPDAMSGDTVVEGPDTKARSTDGGVVTTVPWGVEEVEVWHGATVEVLFVPVEYNSANAGAGPELPTPSAAELTAIGESASFRDLLDVAVASGLVPAADAPAPLATSTDLVWPIQTGAPMGGSASSTPIVNSSTGMPTREPTGMPRTVPPAQKATPTKTQVPTQTPALPYPAPTGSGAPPWS